MGRMRRSIPAYAGTGLSPSKWNATSSEHPRLRGEQEVVTNSTASYYGASPPARGTALGGRVSADGLRIIPACAGNGRPSEPHRRRIIPACAGTGSRPSAADRPCSEHPRLRGDRAGLKTETMGAIGASPPARGPAAGVRVGRLVRRSIPACAGTGGLGGPARPPGPERPRLRGDRGNVATLFSRFDGASPPARGPGGQGAHDGAGDRSIPACAGTGPAGPADARPRAEAFPPTQGPVVETHRGTLRFRSIPTCAGTTGRISSPPNASQEHPRQRGELLRPHRRFGV